MQLICKRTKSLPGMATWVLLSDEDATLGSCGLSEVNPGKWFVYTGFAAKQYTDTEEQAKELLLLLTVQGKLERA